MQCLNVRCELRYEQMDQVLKQIDNGDFDAPPKPKIRKRFIPYSKDPVKTDEKRKQQWYCIRKIVYDEHKVELYKKSRLVVKRTYIYYKDKGNWIGLSPRQLGKMNQA